MEDRDTPDGWLLILKPDTIAMVATDGHRLALRRRTKTRRTKCDVKVLVPKKAMDEVEKLAGRGRFRTLK